MCMIDEDEVLLSPTWCFRLVLLDLSCSVHRPEKVTPWYNPAQDGKEFQMETYLGLCIVKIVSGEINLGKLTSLLSTMPYKTTRQENTLTHAASYDEPQHLGARETRRTTNQKSGKQHTG